MKNKTFLVLAIFILSFSVLVSATKWTRPIQDTFSLGSTDELDEGSINLYDNQSWNESYADTKYLQSFTESDPIWVSEKALYVPIDQIVNYVGNWSLDKSNYFNRSSYYENASETFLKGDGTEYPIFNGFNITNGSNPIHTVHEVGGLTFPNLESSITQEYGFHDDYEPIRHYIRFFNPPVDGGKSGISIDLNSDSGTLITEPLFNLTIAGKPYLLVGSSIPTDLKTIGVSSPGLACSRSIKGNQSLSSYYTTTDDEVASIGYFTYRGFPSVDYGSGLVLSKPNGFSGSWVGNITGEGIPMHYRGLNHTFYNDSIFEGGIFLNGTKINDWSEVNITGSSSIWENISSVATYEGDGNLTGNFTVGEDVCIEGGNCLSSSSGNINGTAINVTTAIIGQGGAGEPRIYGYVNSTYLYVKVDMVLDGTSYGTIYYNDSSTIKLIEGSLDGYW